MRARGASVALAMLLAVGCGGGQDEDEARAQLSREGFREIAIVGRSADGARVSIEAVRGEERCEIELVRGGGPARRAMRCVPDEPIEALERDCEGGEVGRCAEAAARVRSEPPVDWPRATRLSARACEGGEPRECLYVGMAHELGDRGVARDSGAAARMYERACEAGSQPACARLGAARR